MILSISRRTDIPAFFSEWLINRIKDGYALVRNPVNPHQVSRLSLEPSVVDCMVLWSKNPRPLLSRLDALRDYMYYFQFTLNAYGKDLEAFLPSLDERTETFQRLAGLIGKERVLWRYNPIILNDGYTLDWHTEKFSVLARQLHTCTEKCIISFLDLYPGIAKSAAFYGLRTPSPQERMLLAERLSSIARSFGLRLETCAEAADLSAFGIGRARCIDPDLISRLLGCSLDVKKDRNQRPACGCAASIDLGLYNTCRNGCVYCYANHNPQSRPKSLEAFDPLSPLLCSRLTPLDQITERRCESCQDPQLRLF